MAENNGSDATFSYVLWQKNGEKESVSGDDSVWDVRCVRRGEFRRPGNAMDIQGGMNSKKMTGYKLISARVGP
ncbi:hypothetical protein [Pectobacterium wasabiae]|uniref:hypothetical protein n=1 Tax=Pectobacterium wasabiae TaxID=55208 RepID=UPI00027AFFF8|nr:hypothetical protein [Pectobacterium wasabiae]EJS92359.1 Hypothetical protein Y17_4196 [Pectobacterium wasabiae CFBP 3304]